MEITDTGVLEGSFMDFTIPTEFARCALFYMPQYGHFRCNGAYDICRETLDWLLLVCIRAGTRGRYRIKGQRCAFGLPQPASLLL